MVGEVQAAAQLLRKIPAAGKPVFIAPFFHSCESYSFLSVSARGRKSGRGAAGGVPGAPRSGGQMNRQMRSMAISEKP